MRKLRYILLTSLALLFTGSVFAQGIEFFHGSWEEAKAEAKKENKPLFVDAYTSWCGPCKKMSNEVFPTATVGMFFNSNFICYKLDMEKGDGPAVAKTFQVGFYPTFLFLDADGNLIHKSMGFHQASDFLAIGQEALDPSRNLAGLKKRLEGGEKDTAFIYDLIIKTHQLDPALQAEAIKAYWTQVKDEDILKAEHPFRVFMFFENDINSARYNYVLKNQKLVEQKFGKQALRQAIYDKAGGQFQDAIDKKDDARHKRIYEILTSSDDPDIKSFGEFADMIWDINQKNFSAFEKKATAYIKKYPNNNDQIHHLAYAVFATSEDKKLLEKAEGWAKTVSEHDNNFAYAQTYAALLFKNGKYKEAQTAVQTAIDRGKAAGEDYSPAIELQKQIEAKLAANNKN